MELKKIIASALALSSALLIASVASSNAFASETDPTETKGNIGADILESTTETDESDETTEFIETTETSDTTDVSETTEVTTEETTEPKTIQESVIDLINDYRISQSKAQLTESESLDQIAKLRSNEINSLLSHYRPNSKIFSSILTEYGISVKYVGETIATGNDELDTAEEVVKKWIESDEDNKMILENNYQYAGLYLAQSDNSTYKYKWVLILAGSSSYLDGEKNSTQKGDVNGDGKVNSSDAVSVLQCYANTLVGTQKYYTSFYMSRADANGDGKIDSKDATKILVYYAETLAGNKAEL